MVKDIATVPFIVVMAIAVMHFHNSIECSLILEIVTGENVNLISAGDGLIINLDMMMIIFILIIVFHLPWVLSLWLPGNYQGNMCLLSVSFYVKIQSLYNFFQVLHPLLHQLISNLHIYTYISTPNNRL